MVFQNLILIKYLAFKSAHENKRIEFKSQKKKVLTHIYKGNIKH